MHIPGLEVKLDATRLAWRSTREVGIEWFPLYPAEPEQGGPRESTVLIRMQPGCGYRAHVHLDVEEVLVLAGGYRDEAGEHRAGSYMRYDAGSTHAPVALGDPSLPSGPENPACVLFALARGGVRNLPR
jgi:anti-sigma factor ChrR (cupin superfamily)